MRGRRAARRRLPGPAHLPGDPLTRALLALGLLALLPACRGAEPRVRVACVGDSITEGRDIEDPESRYPARLARLLGPGYRVRNLGVGGATLLTSGDRPYVREAAYREALSLRPDVVVIGLGTNDGKLRNWRGQEAFLADAHALVASFRRANPEIRIFVSLPPPVVEPGRFGIRPEIVSGEVTPALLRLGREAGTAIIDLRSALAGRPELLPDRVHPDAAGAAVIAETVARAIHPPGS